MKKDSWSEAILSQMSLEQKIGQCVVVGMSGTVITNDLREAILRYHCSGLRLSAFNRMFSYFSDDKAKKQELGPDFVPSMQKIASGGLPPYTTPAQYAGMLNELRQLAASRSPAIPLHMIIDQEGDTSKDFSRGGVVQFPSNMGLVASRSPELAYEVACCVAKQMKASGLDMIHSPVVDVNINPNNPEIGYRAFSDDPEVVAEYAIAMLKGFKENGVIAAAKHFPGRGDSATDAHHACPMLKVDSDRFNKVELYPYKRLIEAGIDSIMVAHCIYPHIDPDQISTVSRKVVTGILRDQLGFEGMITTDSITMGALIDRYGIGEACARALDAGADIILMKAENQWRGEMFYTIKKWVEDGRIKSEELDDKVRRILRIKKKYGLFKKMGMVKPEKAAKPFSDPIVIETCRKASQKAILVVKDELAALPLDKSKKVLLVNQQNSIKTPNDIYDHPGLFAQLMEQDWPSLQTYETKFGLDAKDEEGVLKFVKANKFDLIICTNYYDRQEKPNTYVKALIDQGYPVLLITNTPYCIKESAGLIPSAKTAVLNMNLTPEGLRTAKAVLFGQLQPEGSWPLSNYDPFKLRK
ncbi:MAG TPA: glycoside hydrolase family 3 N-terminal domain-containing protein [Opitutaceae bacterium]|nr:glycoside hydrolase family 3 N-terminal domain-containing protein [Opitutaceae bacterium]